MQIYTQKTFNIKDLVGISSKNIEEHLKLYAGYVKNANLVLEKINSLSNNGGDEAYIISELQRRFSFEFGGVRNHEYYFSALEDGPVPINKDGKLYSAIEKDFGSFENWLIKFKAMAMTRGIGWAILSYDKKTNQLLNSWTDEQHIGHLISTSPIICLDMWEHAYLFDYIPQDKKKYIEAFFENLNWSVIEKNFTEE